MAATKEAILAKQHEPATGVTIYYMDLRAYGKDFDRYYNRALELGRLLHPLPAFLGGNVPGTRNHRITYTDPETAA
jgi:heterodisulfide reductase subunit A